MITHAGTGDAQAEAFMQGDEAGEEGSGSGRNYPDDDATYDSEGSGEEGSGGNDPGKYILVDSYPYLLLFFPPIHKRLLLYVITCF